MITHIWKFSEVKEMHFTLLLISLCFIAINGGPITTIPTEETNRDGFIEKCEYLNILMNAPYPVQKEIAKYFVTFNNSDLLSVAATCKSFCKPAKKVLNKRMKPLIITNGTTDQQIFSTNEENFYSYNFLMLPKWQPEFALFFDNETSKQYMSRFPRSFQIVPHNSHLQISFIYPFCK
uniref:F-box domain-containing protein n=1 Tax=Onchocerca volvulus TaxID=6282 RepID=A0A2K6VP74_ONCVO